MYPKAINDLSRGNADLAAALREASERVLASGWYVLGREVSGFEEEFAAYCGVRHCVGVANGTDAIELSLKALGVAPGARVLTVGNAGMYTSTAIVAAGARPRFVDISAATMLVDTRRLEAALEGCAALVVTHLYGRMADVEEAVDIASRRGIPVIEDCAQSHGARRNGRRAGSFGSAGCFSFYPTKNLGALGDGGAVVTDDQAVADRLRKLRQYGWAGKYRAELAAGRNSRLDEMQAAFLRAKLPSLDASNARRRAIALGYLGKITHPGVQLPGVPDEADVVHLFVVRARARESLAAHLRAKGVPADVHYPVPDHLQMALEAHGPFGSLPETERVCGEVLTLPCFPEMSDLEVEAVAAAVNEWTAP